MSHTTPLRRLFASRMPATIPHHQPAQQHHNLSIRTRAPQRTFSSTSISRFTTAEQTGTTTSSQTAPSTAASPSSSSSLLSGSSSTNPKYSLNTSSEEPSVPRWATTPKAFASPVRVNPHTPNAEWKVNDDPIKLDSMYKSFLGHGVDTSLSEEVKWLAVTHKSFDHGRRGFNDRLAYLGKRIVELQTSLALLNRNTPSTSTEQRLAHLTVETKNGVLDKTRIARLARDYGMRSVIRWKPRIVSNLRNSGEDVILNTTVYAIIGALALERGGKVANRIVRERILARLGLN